MVAYENDAYSLLTLWHSQANVQAITHYTALVPTIQSETVQWSGGVPTGPNFTLVAGDALWITFPNLNVLDLGVANVAPLNLAAGVSVFSYTRFPSEYTAFRLLDQLGLANVNAVRMLDAETGQWVAAQVMSGSKAGTDFGIPKVAVLMLDLAHAVNNFTPQ
jgi:hypothetical protein